MQKNTLTATLLAIVSSVTGLACCATPAQAPPPAPAVAPKPPEPPPKPVDTGPPVENMTLADVGLDASAMDRTADPCVDFYQFACGGWLAKTEIPADKPVYGTFNVISDRTEEQLHQILEGARTNPGTDPVLTKVGAFYGACMDEAAVDAQGVKGLEPLLAPVRKIKDAKTLGAALIVLQKGGVDAIWTLHSDLDFDDATMEIANFEQAGIGLPDRDYYFRDDDSTKKIRASYLDNVEKMLTLTGMPAKDAKQAAQDVMSVETELARVSLTKVERRDSKLQHHITDRAALKKLAPAFPWDDYFKAVGRADLATANVSAPKFLEGASTLVAKFKPGVWKNYLTWTVVRSFAPTLPKAFVDQNFAYQSSITGQKQLAVRWKRCTRATDAALGELLAQPWIGIAFGGDSKTAAETLIKAIGAEMLADLGQVPWMDAPTRARAQHKMELMMYLIGYPSKWKAYDFPIDPKGYTANFVASSGYEKTRDLGKVGKPVDKQEFGMTPPTVNAYQDTQRNEMVFPAGILQPPFFSAKSSVAANLGAMGMIVGHEITHGFDDQGATFDEQGNLKDWWSPDVVTKFKERTQCVVDQYNAYEPLPGLHINGKLTNGENIADIGGMKLAFRAYRKLRAGAKTRQVADGFTEDQQFFLAAGQAWCDKYTDQIMRLLVQTNEHSPSKYRIIGSLSDQPEFAAAFQCKEGTPMHPKNACEVW